MVKEVSRCSKMLQFGYQILRYDITYLSYFMLFISTILQAVVNFFHFCFLQNFKESVSYN